MIIVQIGIPYVGIHGIQIVSKSLQLIKSGKTDLENYTTNNKWIHLTTKYDANTNTMRVFLDGNLEIEETIKPLSLSGNLIVGANSSGSNLLNSSIDDLQVWNQALPDYLIPALASGARFTFTDTDTDSIPDKYETIKTGNLFELSKEGDADGDGLSDSVEYIFGSNPLKVQSDTDGLTDKQEFDFGSNPNVDDTDGDGLADLDEFVNNTDPNNPDTDGDGLSDLDEIETHFTDPLKADGDDDGIPDAFEIDLVTNIYELSAEGDFDSDGLTDLEEYNGKTMPNKTDTDGDGLNDKDEYTRGSDPLAPDTDLDGLSDLVETNTEIYVSLSNTGTDPTTLTVMVTPSQIWMKYKIKQTLVTHLLTQDYLSLNCILPLKGGTIQFLTDHLTDAI